MSHLSCRKALAPRKSATTKAPTLAGLALFLSLCMAPMHSSAESRLVNGAGNASARVNVRVVISRVLYLGVGDSSVWSGLQNSNAIQTTTWSFVNNPSDVGTGAPAGTTTNPLIFVAVYGNNGQINLAASNPGVLRNGVHTIPMSQIVPNFWLGGIPIPPFGGPAVAIQPVAPGSLITNRIGLWNYRYLNTVVPPSPGTYTAQVTYTATMP